LSEVPYSSEFLYVREYIDESNARLRGYPIKTVVAVKMGPNESKRAAQRVRGFKSAPLCSDQ